MFVVTVEFRSAPEHTGDFLTALRENARASLEVEPGCQRFDVCRDPKDQSRFFLYEIYDDAAAFQAHKASPHYGTFSERIESWTEHKAVAMFRLDGPPA